MRYFPGDHSFLELEREAMCAGVEQDFLAHLLALKAQEMSVLSRVERYSRRGTVLIVLYSDQNSFKIRSEFRKIGRNSAEIRKFAEF